MEPICTVLQGPVSEETYASAIDALEQEESLAFASSSYSAGSFSIADCIAQNTSFRVPWLFSTNPQLLRNVASRINELRSEAAEGHSEDSRGYNRALARSLMRYVTATDGLAVRKVEHASQEWTALEAIASSHEADCSEFASIYYELCRLAGLDASLVKVTVNNYGATVYHFCVGLRLDPASDEFTLVDLTQPQPFDIQHREWMEIPKSSFVAYYYMNRAIQPPMSDRAAQFQFARQNLETAMAIDGDLSLVLFNLGNVYYQFRDLGTDFLLSAKHYLEESIRLDPDYPGASERLEQVLAAMK